MLYFIVIANQDFREESTIKVEKKIEAKEIYTFDQKNVREIEASDSEYGSKRFKINIHGEELNSNLRNNISINFEALDSLSTPYIQYRYSAKGKTYQQAAQRASKINYQAVQLADKIYFNSHFLLDQREMLRDQYVRATVYLPVGSKVVIASGLEGKIRDISSYDCRNAYDEDYHQVKATDWIMTKQGLKCIPILEKEGLEEKNIEESND